jgi:hypothetical protein
MPIEPKNKKSEYAIKSRDKESVKKFANKEENSIAKTIGAKKQPNSGATAFLKGDMILDSTFCIDVKSTKGTRIIVDEDMLVKIENDAYAVGKSPALILNFPRTKKVKRKRWVVIPIK